MMSKLYRFNDDVEPTNALLSTAADKLVSSDADVYAASFGEAFEKGNITNMLDVTAREYQTKNSINEFGFAGAKTGLRSTYARDLKPLIDPAELNKTYNIPGHLLFTTPMSEDGAKEMYERKNDELYRQAIIENARKGTEVGQFVAGAFAQLIDPIGIAASLIPIVPETAVIQLSAKAGGFGRFAIQGAAGAIEGAVGNALLEPAIYSMANDQQLSYTQQDSIANIALGGVFGGVLHSGSYLVKKKLGLEPDWKTQSDAIKQSLDQAIRDKNIEPGHMFYRNIVENVKSKVDYYRELLTDPSGIGLQKVEIKLISDEIRDIEKQLGKKAKVVGIKNGVLEYENRQNLVDRLDGLKQELDQAYDDLSVRVLDSAEKESAKDAFDGKILDEKSLTKSNPVWRYLDKDLTNKPRANSLEDATAKTFKEKKPSAAKSIDSLLTKTQDSEVNAQSRAELEKALDQISDDLFGPRKVDTPEAQAQLKEKKTEFKSLLEKVHNDILTTDKLAKKQEVVNALSKLSEGETGEVRAAIQKTVKELSQPPEKSVFQTELDKLYQEIRNGLDEDELQEFDESFKDVIKFAEEADALESALESSVSCVLKKGMLD